jgi:hypothetical protein
LLYTDRCARRPKMMNATNAPSTTPSAGIVIRAKPPDHTPIATEMATISTNAPIM